MLLYAPFVVWAIVWTLQLINCLLRKQFPPTLGTDSRSRILWLATFALLDPFLTLLYFVFVVWGLGKGARWTRVVTAISVCLTLAGMLLGHPGWGSEGPHSLRYGDLGPSNTDLHVGVTLTEGQLSAGWMTVPAKGAIAVPKHVEIVLDGSVNGLNRAAEILTERLWQFPYIERIDWVPMGKSPKEVRGPDFRIYLKVETTSRLPLWMRLSPWSLVPIETSVHMDVTHWNDDGYAAQTETNLPMAIPMMYSDGHRQGLQIGYGLLSSREVPLSEIEDWADSLVQSLDERLIGNRPLEALPEAYYGTYQAPPDFPFLAKLNAQRVILQSDYEAHTKSVWLFDVSGWDQFEELQVEIVNLGFAPYHPQEGQPAGTFTKGNEWISVAPDTEFLAASHWSKDDGTSGVRRPEFSDVRYHLHYRLKFSEADDSRLSDSILHSGDAGLIGAQFANRTRGVEDRASYAPLRAAPVLRAAELLTRSWIARRVDLPLEADRWLRLAKLWVDAGLKGHDAKDPFGDWWKSQVKWAKVDVDTFLPATLADYATAGFHVMEPGSTLRIETDPYAQLGVVVPLGGFEGDDSTQDLGTWVLEWMPEGDELRFNASVASRGFGQSDRFNNGTIGLSLHGRTWILEVQRPNRAKVLLTVSESR